MENFQQIRSNDPNLTYMDLYYTFHKLSETLIISLFDAIRTNTSLTTLNLSWNNIGGHSESVAISLAEAIETNTSLTALDLYSNNLGALSKTAEACLFEAIHANTCLTTLEIAGNSFLKKYQYWVGYVEKIMERNREIVKNVRRAVWCFLWCGNSIFGKDVTWLIARELWKSKGQREWLKTIKS